MCDELRSNERIQCENSSREAKKKTTNELKRIRDRDDNLRKREEEKIAPKITFSFIHNIICNWVESFEIKFLGFSTKTCICTCQSGFEQQSRIICDLTWYFDQEQTNKQTN